MIMERCDVGRRADVVHSVYTTKVKPKVMRKYRRRNFCEMFRPGEKKTTTTTNLSYIIPSFFKFRSE